MSPRRHPRHRSAPPERGHGTPMAQSVESWPDGDWVVRTLSGGATGDKTYRCPGCDQEIPASAGHLVAWPADGPVDDRRHWHTSCWRARSRRGPNVQRSRNAPRYG